MTQHGDIGSLKVGLEYDGTNVTPTTESEFAQGTIIYALISGGNPSIIVKDENNSDVPYTTITSMARRIVVSFEMPNLDVMIDGYTG